MVNDVQRDVPSLDVGSIVLSVVLSITAVLVACLLKWFQREPPIARVRVAGVDQNEQNSNPTPHTTEDFDCPICLSACQWPCATTCGHQFCAECVTAYWRARATSRALSCPCCRAPVTLLIPGFTAEGEAHDRDVRQARLSDIDEYNAAHGLANARSLGEALRSALPLLRALGRQFLEQPLRTVLIGLRLRQLLLIVGVLVYLISPIDFIPEVIFGVAGLIDDAIVFGVMLLMIASFYREVIVRDAARDARRGRVD